MSVTRLNRYLDALAAPYGIAACLVVIAAFTTLTVLSFQDAARKVKSAGKLFEERQMRDGVAAVNDLQRLNHVLADGSRYFGFRVGPVDRLREASDYLYVRADTLRSQLLDSPGRRYGEEAVTAMFRIVDMVDAELSDGSPDYRLLMEQTTPVAESARASMMLYLDDVRHAHDRVVEEHKRAFVEQSASLWVFLFALTSIGLAALMLLRREVFARRDLQDAERTAAFLAYHDGLTGLPNRRQFQDHVERHARTGAPAALLFTDLDNFKGINDTLGHAVGDEVLKVTANRLTEALDGTEGMVARLSGDEFAIFLKTDETARISALCDEILRLVHCPIWHEGEVVSPGISIGIATTACLPDDLDPDFSSLARVADFALYTAKSAGRGRYRMFDAAMECQFTSRRLMIRELPDAIRNKELTVFLQPKVDLSTGATTGFEALVRWRRYGQIVEPGEFIQLAEESGVVTEVDHFVLREALALMAEWNEKYRTKLGVSVNLSAVHFNSAAIVMEIGRVLQDTGFPPGLLTLEITETVQLRNWDKVRVVIEALRRLGCRIAIDDFGTGYSSLSYLQSIRADELKIDRSMVTEVPQNEDAVHVVRSVVALARSLHMKVVVEGVETEAQAAFLFRIGCDTGQGFYFSPPEAAGVALPRSIHRPPNPMPIAS